MDKCTHFFLWKYYKSATTSNGSAFYSVLIFIVLVHLLFVIQFFFKFVNAKFYSRKQKTSKQWKFNGIKIVCKTVE